MSIQVKAWKYENGVATELFHTAGTPTTTFQGPGIVFRPGLASDYNGKQFPLTEGLFMFQSSSPNAYGLTPYNDGGYRLIVPASNPDVYKIMYGACFIIGWGGYHTSETTSQIVNRMRWSQPAVQCAKKVAVIGSILSGEGIPWREVHILETDPSLIDGSDDGHRLMEVYINGSWRAFDVACNLYWTDSSGEHLSMKGIKDVVGYDNALVVQNAPLANIGGLTSTNLVTNLFCQTKVYNEQTYRDWFEEKSQVYGIKHPTINEVWFRDDGSITSTQKSYIEGLTTSGALYKVKSAATFDGTFY